MISLVAAIDLNNAIGYKNNLLCRLPNDMKHFKSVTTSGNHNVVVMGRKTYESIGKPLSERTNIILTRDKKFIKPVGTYVYNSVEEVLKQYQNYGIGDVDLWVVGGSEIYEQFLPHADRLYITSIQYLFEKADAHFPEIDIEEWNVVHHISNKVDMNNEYDHDFLIWERVKN